MTDVTFNNQGTLFLAHLNTDAAREWVDHHIPDDAQFWGNALVMEHRYAREIAQGMLDDGLEVD